MEEQNKSIIELYRNAKDRIVFDRVPWKTKKAFTQFASEEFANDYGMCLKWLWDFYEGSLLPKESHFTIMLQDLSERIDVLEAKGEAPEENTIKLGSGYRIERKRS